MRAEPESPEQIRRRLLLAQQASLQQCERRFAEAARGYRTALQMLRTQPAEAADIARSLAQSMVDEVAGEREVAIRLLSEQAGEESALHALNVSVLSVLLGRACGCGPETLRDIGLGALLHDAGKLELPERLRWSDGVSLRGVAERRLYQEHVAHGARLVAALGLPPAAEEVVRQHHEHADGSGYPEGLGGDRIGRAAQIVALVNRYDNLCNPANPVHAVTPHDALALLFARERPHFDAAVLAAFIRMMGVYPPGSLVQLNDERYALSVSVNPMRPLRPRVLIHDPRVPPEEALVVDLEDHPELGVQRALRPVQLPRAVFDYLSPRRRNCYFFERSRDLPGDGVEA